MRFCENFLNSDIWLLNFILKMYGLYFAILILHVS